MARPISWFAGHMVAALKDAATRLKAVDVVVEVRDARVPLSSVNPAMEQLVQGKRRILALSKTDLVTPGDLQAALRHLKHQANAAVKAVVPVSTQGSGGMRSANKVLGEVVSLIAKERPHADENLMMVIGLPNAGKSSLINALKASAVRKGLIEAETRAAHKQARTGPLPGVTRHLSSFQVSKQPRLFVLDTPGILQPRLEDHHAAMSLGLIGALPETVTEARELALHLMQLLGGRKQHLAELSAVAAQHAQHSKPGKRPLPELLLQVLTSAPAAEVGNMMHGGEELRLHEVQLQRLLELMLGPGQAAEQRQQHAAMTRLIQAFRTGQLGRHILDDIQAV